MKTTRATQGRAVPALRVNVKLTEESDPVRYRHVLSGLEGVRSVTQTFPDERDEELKRLFVLEIEPSKLETALEELRRRREVEYAEQAPLRKLIR